jgi:hypothetical protein
MDPLAVWDSRERSPVWPHVRCPGLVIEESKCQARTHLTVRKEEEGRRPPCWRPYNPLQIAARSIGAASALPLRCLCAASALLRCGREAER